MMDEQEKQMLQRALELSEENNKLLHSLRNQSRWAHVFGIIKWLIILGSLVWSYYYLQPYLQQIAKLYQQTQAVQTNSQNMFQNLMNNFNSTQTQPKGYPTNVK